MRVHRLPLFALVIVYALPSLAEKGPEPAALIERLHTAEAATSLDTADLKPWHLKLTVQLLGKDGKPTQEGTIEEWWQSPKKHRIDFDLPNYRVTELLSEDGYFRTKDAGHQMWAVSQMLHQVVHPLELPNAESIASMTPEFTKQVLGKVSLDCIMLSPERRRGEPLGTFPTYCFDSGDGRLRLTYGGGSEVIIRNAFGPFQNRTVAVDSFLQLRDIKVASAHVAALDGKPFPSDVFSMTDALVPVPLVARISSSMLGGGKLSGGTPVYPDIAKRRHISGLVLLEATIGKDGHIANLTPIYSPDPSLEAAATDAVRTWTYRPYLLNGAPSEVETTITVTFSLGGR